MQYILLQSLGLLVTPKEEGAAAAARGGCCHEAHHQVKGKKCKSETQ